jgi:hypothetical protein
MARLFDAMISQDLPPNSDFLSFGGNIDSSAARRAWCDTF